MEIRKADIKRIMLPIAIATAIFCIICAKYVNIQAKRYSQIFAEATEEIIGVVKKSYPETNEEEIIKILQDKSKTSGEKGKKLLKQYGYSDNNLYIEKLEKEIKYTKTRNIFIIIVFGITTLIIVGIYIIRQNKKIIKINTYLKKVNNGNYKLEIQENNEDELSKLRNELYKTTILLRETAENSKKESKNLSNSLADISHQIKTPLTSIRIMIDNLCENPDMDKETRDDFMQTISNQLDWISSLVISLLKLSKFDSGTIEMQDKKIKAKDLLEDVIKNLSIMLEIKNIDVVCNVEEKAEFVADYKWQLEAITNIVKNAVEHSNENSKIYINVEDSSVLLKITIKDEGSGIKSEDLKHIFERFYKSENASENSIGIGLSLAKTIIEKDNGYITVDSEIGKGTTFTIKYMK